MKENSETSTTPETSPAVERTIPASPYLVHRGLDPFFIPRSVAVIGATPKPESVGRTVLWNLISQPFGGTVYAVNPHRHNVLGSRTYPSVRAIEEPVDLAVIVTPAPAVTDVVRECAEAGVKGAIIISAGFKETGEDGLRLEQAILEEARRGRMRVIGPNCLGVMNPLTGLNASFAHVAPLRGRVGFLSQSGALCTAILDWSLRERVGFSAFVSLGSMLDVGWGDLIYYLGDDPSTKSIIIYMETIGDARRFMSAAREVALTKPIIVLKPGRTEAGAKAAASHTGSMAGDDAVVDAAFQRCGVLRVNTISGLFDMAEVLAKQPRPRGPRLAILTNAGGPGVLAADALLEDGGQLAALSTDTRRTLDVLLPPHWSHDNPVDILGDAGPERFAHAAEIVAADSDNDGLLVVLSPQSMTAPTETAQRISQLRLAGNKPLLASWMGGVEVAPGEAILNQNSIPSFPYPDAAAKIFTSMWRYSENLEALYETPSLPAGGVRGEPGKARVDAIIRDHLDANRTLLSEFASRQVLEAYGIATVPGELAATPDEAVAAADRLGYPSVLKLHSLTITHKSDVGGVRLRLNDADAVRAAFESIRCAVREKGSEDDFHGVIVQPMVATDGYELIIGSSVDAQFGPVLLFGAGGQLTEILHDVALGLPPLNSTLARRMVIQTRIAKALQGVRGRPPVNLRALDDLLVTFSQLVCEQPRIKEIDINPMLASPEGFMALDVRMVLHDACLAELQLPGTAIRPYPREYAGEVQLRNGERVLLRPIRPEDEALMIRFHESLSEDTVYRRFFGALPLRERTRHGFLTRYCFIDYDRAMALVAVRGLDTGTPAIVGVARYSKDHDRDEAEFAVVTSDACQRQGLGRHMVESLAAIATAEGITRLYGAVLADNLPMLELCDKTDFHRIGHDGNAVLVERLLRR